MIKSFNIFAGHCAYMHSVDSIRAGPCTATPTASPLNRIIYAFQYGLCLCQIPPKLAYNNVFRAIEQGIIHCLLSDRGVRLLTLQPSFNPQLDLG